ncbi:ATP-binding cassette subfamily B protein [Bacillus fengqiuensis]|nr:ATP-binding cassette subfamily B protein [Bacillus fengqiuensis]
MLKMLSFLKPYRFSMGIALFFMIVELAVELCQPLLIAKIIDEGIVKEDLGVVLKWGGIMMALSLSAFMVGILNSFYAAHVSQRFGYDVRKELFAKIQGFSFSNFNDFPTSSLITRMTGDVTQIQQTVFMGLRIMLRAPLLVIGGLVMALIVNTKLALAIVMTAPVIFVLLVWAMKKSALLFRSVQENVDTVNGIMRENLTGMRLIKAFFRKQHEIDRFTLVSQHLKNRTVAALKVMETTMPMLLFVLNLSIIAVLWFGSKEVYIGRAQVGEVVAIVNYAFRITSAFSILSFLIMFFSRARASSSRIVEVLETKEGMMDAKSAHSMPAVAKGKIEFDQVSFHYPGNETPVLQNLSFTVPAGTTTAILGATGSGKSSLFQLIPRLYDVNEGKILIDDLPIDTIKLSPLRRSIGFVPQESFLFSGTVLENIRWGKEDASMEEVRKAAEDAQIHDTILTLPKQYETVLGQKGVNLSGGQKQRLSIARALVRNPKILLLDDSTSALDMKTEANLLQAIRTYSCTTMIITQKISTAMKADNILLLEDGKLLVQGNHEQLLEQSALYQAIFQSQFGKEVLPSC